MNTIKIAMGYAVPMDTQQSALEGSNTVTKSQNWWTTVSLMTLMEINVSLSRALRIYPMGSVVPAGLIYRNTLTLWMILVMFRWATATLMMISLSLVSNVMKISLSRTECAFNPPNTTTETATQSKTYQMISITVLRCPITWTVLRQTPGLILTEEELVS